MLCNRLTSLGKTMTNAGFATVIINFRLLFAMQVKVDLQPTDLPLPASSGSSSACIANNKIIGTNKIKFDQKLPKRPARETIQPIYIHCFILVIIFCIKKITTFFICHFHRTNNCVFFSFK